MVVQNFGHLCYIIMIFHCMCIHSTLCSYILSVTIATTLIRVNLDFGARQRNELGRGPLFYFRRKEKRLLRRD